MNGPQRDWLCDGAGEPDAFERGVEESLRGVRMEPDVGSLLARLEANSDSPTTARPLKRRSGWRRPALLAAAGVLLAVGAWALLLRDDGPAWERAGGGAWRVGAWIETGSGTEEFAAVSVGRVMVGPGSRVRLLAATDEEHRLELAEGSLEAFIYAPPRLFFVETPGATAVDMGCAYELDVAADGSGLLRVTGGWVELEAKDGSGLASRVPAGAVCAIGADGTPGVPWFEDAPPGLGEAVSGTLSGDGDELARVLSLARARDGLTLWHMIARTTGDDRVAVVDRLAALVPGEARDGALSLEAEAMESWWQAVRRAW